MNSRAPQIHGTVKLHKPNRPIRPIVNWTDSRGYKVAKLINTLLNSTLQFPNAFNVLNTNHLIQSPFFPHWLYSPRGPWPLISLLIYHNW
jgi:hypothetical protein